MSYKEFALVAQAGFSSFLSRLSVEVTLCEIDSRNEWSAKATTTVYLKGLPNKV